MVFANLHQRSSWLKQIVDPVTFLPGTMRWVFGHYILIIRNFNTVILPDFLLNVRVNQMKNLTKTIRLFKIFNEGSDRINASPAFNLLF